MAKLEIGLQGKATDLVDSNRLASTWGSGGLPVYATPAAVALAEKAALQSVAPYLEEGQSTVGTKIIFEHLAATPLGLEVEAVSELVEIDRRRLVFKFEVKDSAGLIAQGEHERFIVQNEKFLAKAQAKKA